MNKFQSDLGVQSREVLYGIAVEQALVGLAGIEDDQTGAQFRSTARYTTHFTLQLNQEKAGQLRTFYDQSFPGLIIGMRQLGENQVKIEMSTPLLMEQVSPAMAQNRAPSARPS